MYLLAMMGCSVRGELFYLISIHYNTLALKDFCKFIGIYFLEGKNCQSTEGEQFSGEERNQCMFVGIIRGCSCHLPSIEILSTGIILNMG